MANYDDNPFAGDSENPFAVSVFSQQACLCRMIIALVMYYVLSDLGHIQCSTYTVLPENCFLSRRTPLWLLTPAMQLVVLKISTPL